MVDIGDIVKLADIADGQWGQVTVEQAGRVGVPEATLVELEALHLIEPVIDEVVRLRAGGRHSMPRLYAAWLRLAPETLAWERSLPHSGVVSHRSAVRLYRLGDLPGEHPQFTVSPGVVAPDARTRRADLGPGSWQWVDGLPVTTPSRTVLDLVDEPLDITEVQSLIRGFVQNGWATVEDLTADFSSAERRKWAPLLDVLQAEEVHS
ncbi:hypothetical protein JNW91_15740 [Micromonospora sp. STR1_7]|uniref:AbiEi antitoxin C-terminal domain-containing protein n=1 Tax=Micromonospora parastrephiae TaxID=2806101 RepID=A0ABS1XV84_9ACTN|nr:hypothetical protein [Micromonospora parastrephiae]MBM0233187.1 hypothetical protein [Micromonospora parastrephiae]